MSTRIVGAGRKGWPKLSLNDTAVHEIVTISRYIDRSYITLRLRHCQRQLFYAAELSGTTDAVRIKDGAGNAVRVE